MGLIGNVTECASTAPLSTHAPVLLTPPGPTPRHQRWSFVSLIPMCASLCACAVVCKTSSRVGEATPSPRFVRCSSHLQLPRSPPREDRGILNSLLILCPHSPPRLKPHPRFPSLPNSTAINLVTFLLPPPSFWGSSLSPENINTRAWNSGNRPRFTPKETPRGQTVIKSPDPRVLSA